MAILSKKLTPSSKEIEWTSNAKLNLSTVNMVKEPLNVGYSPAVRAPVYHSPLQNSRPTMFDDTSLLLANELSSINQCDVVDIKKPNEAQSCIQPPIPTYNVESPAVCFVPSVAHCVSVVEETKRYCAPSYDCSSYSSSSYDSSSSSSSNSSSD